MKLHRSLPLVALVAVTGFTAMPVSAAKAAVAGDLGGNPVPGVCLLSREAVFAQSKVGQVASQRLKQLAEQQQNQLESQRKPLDTDIQSFEKQAPSLTEAQRKSKGTALHNRMEAFQKQSGEVSQRIQLTRGKVMERIGAQAQPIVASLYKSHHCGLLLNRDAVLSGNMSNDLTAEAVQGLDRKMTTISFNLEPVSSGSGK